MHWQSPKIREHKLPAACDRDIVEKLRISVDIVVRPPVAAWNLPRYAAPKRTDTSFDTPGSCMVTP